MSGAPGDLDSGGTAKRGVASIIGRHWRKFVGGLVTLIVAPVAVALISNALSGDSSSTSASAGVRLGPDLQADKLVVRDLKYDTMAVEISGNKQAAFKQTRASMPRVVLTVSNTGDRRAVLTGMVFSVRDYAELPPCTGAGAATLLNGEYQVRLPARARVGQSIGLDLDRNVAPDGVDRFALRFAGRLDLIDRLYVLDVAARVSRVPALQRIGAIAISVPGLPDPPEYLEADAGGVPPASISECFARNRRALQRIATHRGATTDPALKAVADRAARVDAAARR